MQPLAQDLADVPALPAVIDPAAVELISGKPTPPRPPRKPMAERVEDELDAFPLGHEWVVDATLSVDFKTAKRADFRGMFRSEAGMRIDALEVLCHVCRRKFSEVADTNLHVCLDVHPDTPRCGGDGVATCSGQLDNSHLIGGDLRVREKRIKHEPIGHIVHTRIDRQGMAGYSVHAGR